MKSLEFIYQDTQIHFALQNEGNVMVNATEMAKAFNKRVDHFLKAAHTKKFIELLQKDLAEFTPNGGNSDVKIIESRGHVGTFMHEALALKFAAWLDVEFEVWVYKRIQEIIFGNYKKHWDAHVMQEEAKKAMEQLKPQLLTNPTPELVAEYFEAEKLANTAKNIKAKAIREQYKLF